jgi:hypothetical protein
MKKLLALLSAALLLLILASGCGRATATASQFGYCSSIRLKAAVEDDGSVVITLVSHSETTGIGDYAVLATVARINENKSVAVDAVSGATVSSLATIAAADKALSKLSADTSGFYEAPLNKITEYLNFDYDVAVIGAGGAGLTAAIEAARLGADVVILEKLGIPGGSTARSDGKIMATGTELQAKFREIDSTSSFAGYLYEYADKSIGSSRQLELAEHSAANLRFLEELDVAFTGELSPAFEDQRPQRTHSISPGLEGSGGMMIKPLVDKALSLGVDIIYNTEAYELLQDLDGRILGVRGKSVFGDVITVNAKAVVLATGGFDRNASLLAEYRLSSGRSVSGLGSTGDGIEMARRAGARIFPDASLIGTLEDLNTGLFETTGLIVAPDGERVGNEAGNPFLLSSELISRGFSSAFLIADASSYRAAQRKGLNESSVFTAESLGELSAMIEVPGLSQTVARYNALCDAVDDSDFGKPQQYLARIEGGPFCAVPLSLKTSGTLGGIATNGSCQALDRDGNIIGGLYAAGETMNGAFFLTGFPAYGVSLAQVIETGRISGAHAAAHAMGK